MFFYGIVAIVVGLFLIFAIYLLIKENYKNIKKVLLNIIFYFITAILLLTFGIIALINISEIMNIICVGIMIVSLLTLVIFITIDERKNRKVIKLSPKKKDKDSKNNENN